MLFRSESDDAWARDVGPTYVVDDKGNRMGINWKFNAWGGNVDVFMPHRLSSFCKPMCRKPRPTFVMPNGVGSEKPRPPPTPTSSPPRPDDVVDLPPKQAVRQSVKTTAESTDIMFVLFIIMLITFVVIESKFF